MKEERKPDNPKKTPDDELQKTPHTKAQIQASTEIQTPTPALVADLESRRANHYTTVTYGWLVCLLNALISAR